MSFSLKPSEFLQNGEVSKLYTVNILYFFLGGVVIYKTQAIPRTQRCGAVMAKHFGNDTPESLVQTAWFYLMLSFGRQG